jgi:hypothetical protein
MFNKLLGHFQILWLQQSPVHRISILIGCGLLLVFCLICLFKSDSKPETTNTIGLISDRDLPKNMVLQPLFFSFKTLTQKENSSCSAPYLYTDIHHLQEFELNQALQMGEVLCHKHLKQTQPLISIRKGYRAIGFKLKNTEILPFIHPGDLVEAYFPNMSSQFRLKDIKIMDIFLDTPLPIVLLEISSKQLTHLQPALNPDLPITLLLKNKNEQVPIKIKPPGPKIQADDVS